MEPKMSQITRTEVLAAKRDRHAQAGKEHKTKIINELVELLGCHRKAAILALQSRPVIAAPFVLSRPKEYDPDPLGPPLKAIFGWGEAAGVPALVRQSVATTAREDQPAPRLRRDKRSPRPKGQLRHHPEVRFKQSDSNFCASKAPVDWRSPRRFANTCGRSQARQRFGVPQPSAALSVKLVKKQVFIVYQ